MVNLATDKYFCAELSDLLGQWHIDSDRYHFDFTMIIDRAVPLIPTVYLDLCAGISFLGGELHSGVTERKGRILPVCGDRSDSTFGMFCVFSDLCRLRI